MKLALAAFFLLFPSLAFADCTSLSSFMKDVETRAVKFSVETVVDLHGDAAQPLVNAYNAVPPASTHSADEVVLLRGISRTTGAEMRDYIAALFNGGCLVEASIMNSKYFQPLIGKES